MIQSFNVPVDEVATYAGWMSALFSLCQCLTAIAWGRASDSFGRKPTILLAMCCIMIGSVAFGFSSSLVMAFCMRALQGLSSGNVGIIRTTVAEMVPQKELQPRAFSVMPLVWNVGSIFGPTLGGSLVRPVERYPGWFHGSALLSKYPFALPNLVISVLFMIGLLSGILFLHETHEALKRRRDYGLVLGQALAECSPRSARRKARASHTIDDDESEPFLGEDMDHASPLTPKATAAPRQPTVEKKTSWKDVFTYQSKINLIAYTGLAMHSTAFDQLVPVFLHYPTNDSLRGDGKGTIRLPFRFSGGFSLDSPQIGVLFTIYGVFGMFVQFLAFPPLARRYGVLNCFKACTLTFPLVYLLIPFTSLFGSNGARQTVLLAGMLVKCSAGIFAFPCSTIMLTNSAASLRTLGTLNGVATSISALGRAVGPAIAGAAFTAGVDAGYVIVPFWVLAAIAAVAAVPVWWLVEMEGFAAQDTTHDDDSVDGDAAADTSAQHQNKTVNRDVAGLAMTTAVDEPDLVAEDLLGSSKPSTRQSTAGSDNSVVSGTSLRRATSPMGLTT